METSRREFGVLYFLDENPHFQRMLDISIRSLKRYHPDWPVKVVTCPTFSVSHWRRLYRSLSFWKWQERRKRGQQDWRVIFAKARGMIETPFEHTLYLDVDTVVLRPLHELRKSALEHDVMATPLDWKAYQGFDSWHPETFPMIMAGVVLYNQRFIQLYREFLPRVRHGAGKYFAGDQFMFSLFCHCESERVRLRREPYLQLDAMNIAQHLGTEDYPRRNGVLDLRHEGLKPFHIFHYNGPHKREYLDQIGDLWGYMPKESSCLTAT